jgi:hypothetical protein
VTLLFEHLLDAATMPLQDLPLACTSVQAALCDNMAVRAGHLGYHSAICWLSSPAKSCHKAVTLGGTRKCTALAAARPYRLRKPGLRQVQTNSLLGWVSRSCIPDLECIADLSPVTVCEPACDTPKHRPSAHDDSTALCSTWHVSPWLRHSNQAAVDIILSGVTWAT